VECPTHLIILTYSCLGIALFTMAWYIANLIVSWRYENYYPINYKNLKREKEALENELQRYKKKFGELP
jgi:hypothetical protein